MMLAPRYNGMRIDIQGVLGRIRDDKYGKELNYVCGTILQHLEELATRYYAGDVQAVDEFLQLYCLDKARPTEGEIK